MRPSLWSIACTLPASAQGLHVWVREAPRSCKGHVISEHSDFSVHLTPLFLPPVCVILCVQPFRPSPTH